MFKKSATGEAKTTNYIGELGEMFLHLAPEQAVRQADVHSGGAGAGESQ